MRRQRKVTTRATLSRERERLRVPIDALPGREDH